MQAKATPDWGDIFSGSSVAMAAPDKVLIIHRLQIA
jgi:hypothetical protein